MEPFCHVIAHDVSRALSEDWGTVGDVTSFLVSEDARICAELIVFDQAVLCGQTWFVQSFHQVDSRVSVRWFFQEGERVRPGERVAEIVGPARSVFSAERVALNFLQMLSGIATQTSYFVSRVQGTGCCIYDSRKTLPGLRFAQKYAVSCGGGHNHRFGLYDLVLIKDNHIACIGAVSDSVSRMRAVLKERGWEHIPMMIEVDTLEQMNEAVSLSVPFILLDNMDAEQVRLAVSLNQGRAVLEVSGGITLETVRDYAETGVDRISIGSLTKCVVPIDFSLQVRE